MMALRAVQLGIVNNISILFLGLTILGLTTYHSLDRRSFMRLLGFFRGDSKPYLEYYNLFSGNVDTSASLPDIVHYIRFGLTAKCYTQDQMKALLSVIQIHRPSQIYIHTDDVGPVKEIVSKISKNYTLHCPITVKYYPQPKHIFGLPLNRHNLLKHAVDFTKLKILRRYGGIFLDNNVHLVRSLKKFLNFEMTVVLRPRPDHNFFVDLRDDVVIAHRNARFLHLWLKTYHLYNEKEMKHTLSPTVRLLLQENEFLVKKMENDLPEILSSNDKSLENTMKNKSYYFVTITKDKTRCMI